MSLLLYAFQGRLKTARRLFSFEARALRYFSISDPALWGPRTSTFEQDPVKSAAEGLNILL